MTGRNEWKNRSGWVKKIEGNKISLYAEQPQFGNEETKRNFADAIKHSVTSKLYELLF
jgi:hypothetical protein